MQSLPSYEYLVSRLRARASSLFDRASYRALLGSSNPLEADFTLNQSRFSEHLPPLTATDYEGIRKWLSADFPETFDFTEGNAPIRVRPLLSKVRDIFTAIYLSRLTAGRRGVEFPLGKAIAIPSTRQLHALDQNADLEALLQAFLDDQLRDQAEELVSFATEAGKVFPLFSLPAFAARNALLFAESLRRSEFGGLGPLLDAVSEGSMMVASACSGEEGGDITLFAESFKSALGDSPAFAEADAAASVAEAERLCWVESASLARKCLIGYPFRARTVVGLLFLEWFDVANWRLAVLALQGVLTVEEADRAFIIA